jgi:hypothetical protein
MSLNIDPTVTVIKALFLYFNLLNNIANIQENKLMLIHNQNAGIHYKSAKIQKKRRTYISSSEY